MLNSNAIGYEMAYGTIRIEPFDPAQMQPNSYDVRLAGEFYLTYPYGDQYYFFGPVVIATGQRVYLPPACTVLCHTIEVVGSTDDIVIQMRNKSSTARCGIAINNDAGFGDIGYNNIWTFELVNNNAQAAPLMVGAAFAQAAFVRSEGAPLAGAALYSGQYAANDWPQNMVPKAWRHNIIPAPPSLDAFMRTGCNMWPIFGDCETSIDALLGRFG